MTGIRTPRVVLLLASVFLGPCLARAIPGGLLEAPVHSEPIRNAAAYAIQAQERLLQTEKGAEGSKLKLVKIIAAREQVVAGMNYHLKLLVKANHKDRQADVVVWWQAWRQPEPYELTSWKWIND